ncbi:MAG: hypothetical protein IKQ07_04530 [Bacteroidaceae bacterium]|nr:hypothetical protein [Bacteroidaceae bacterium]
MSYTIFYRSMFVKTSDNKFIPMIESGDNNVWEAGSQRRAREWHNCGWLTRENYTLNSAELMHGVEQMIDSVKEQYVGKLKDKYNKDCTERWTEQEVEKQFGYFEGLAIGGKWTGKTSAQMLRNFFRKGMERAVNIDEVTLNVHWCTEFPHYEQRYPRNEAELMEAIKEGQDAGHRVWIDYSNWEAERLWNLRQAQTKVHREKKEHLTGFVVTFRGSYVRKMSSRRLWSYPYLQHAKRYTSRSTAEKVVERIKRGWTDPGEVKVIAVRKNGDIWEAVA